MRRADSGFTLIELIAVIVVLAILAGVALPAYFDHRNDAQESADEGALGGINTALHTAYLHHRLTGAPSEQWVSTFDDVAAVMDIGQLPEGMTVENNRLVDQRGNEYELTPQTASEPARLRMVTGPPGGATLPVAALLVALLPWLGERRRRLA